jgi:hypothetical protein
MQLYLDVIDWHTTFLAGTDLSTYKLLQSWLSYVIMSSESADLLSRSVMSIRVLFRLCKFRTNLLILIAICAKFMLQDDKQVLCLSADF